MDDRGRLISFLNLDKAALNDASLEGKEHMNMIFFLQNQNSYSCTSLQVRRQTSFFWLLSNKIILPTNK